MMVRRSHFIIVLSCLMMACCGKATDPVQVQVDVPTPIIEGLQVDVFLPQDQLPLYTMVLEVVTVRPVYSTALEEPVIMGIIATLGGTIAANVDIKLRDFVVEMDAISTRALFRPQESQGFDFYPLFLNKGHTARWGVTLRADADDLVRRGITIDMTGVEYVLNAG